MNAYEVTVIVLLSIIAFELLLLISFALWFTEVVQRVRISFYKANGDDTDDLQDDAEWWKKR